jgi:hypothetical protein
VVIEGEEEQGDSVRTGAVRMVEAIGELLSGAEEWTEATVSAPKDVAGTPDTGIGGKVDRVRELLAAPDGVKRRALIMAGVWESAVSPQEVEHLMGKPGKVVGFTAGGGRLS